MKMRGLALLGLVMLLGFALAVDAQPGRRRRGGLAEMAQPESQQLPAPVSSAISSTFPDATVGEFEQDTDDGVSVYFVDLSTGAEVEVTSDGTIVVASYGITMTQVPAAAAQAIQKATAGATITEILRDEIHADIEGGRAVKLEKPVTEYLAVVSRGGQEGEISVLADGTIVGPLEWGPGE